MRQPLALALLWLLGATAGAMIAPKAQVHAVSLCADRVLASLQ